MSTKGKLCMRKILVTGAGGFVGARILDQWRGRYELCTFPHGFSANSDEAAVRALIARATPDVIVHTAALSNTAYCASHPEESLRANVLLPEWIAKAAVETGTKLLAFSSDQVYAGCKRSGPLSETLSLAPANVYGCHKLEAEQRVPYPGQPAAKPAECRQNRHCLAFFGTGFPRRQLCTGSH